MTDPREAKLPVWAQNELQAARERAERAEAALAEHFQTIPKTRVVYGRYENPMYLPDDVNVEWQMSDIDRTFYQIQVRREGNALIVNGGSSIRIKPTASNLIHVYLEN